MKTSISWKQYGVDDYFSDNIRNEGDGRPCFRISNVNPGQYSCIIRDGSDTYVVDGIYTKKSAQEYFESLLAERRKRAKRQKLAVQRQFRV